MLLQGTSEKTFECQTCGHKLEDCAGHFGHVSLELPVFHFGYFKTTYNILQKICKVCVWVGGEEINKQGEWIYIYR